MTSKLSWIAFIPFALAAIAIKVIQLFFIGPDGTFYGFNSLMLSYLAIACAVVVMLFAVIFCLIDRKTAQVYLIHKNFVAGIFGLLLAVSLACDGANRAFYAFGSMGVDFFEIADIILTLLCAIVFVVLGLNHFVGNGGVKGLSVFYLVPALWSALRLVECFLSFTTVSIAVTDVSPLVCYVFATLFLFNYATIVALMKGKGPVRASFIYGMPAAIMLVSYGAYSLVSTLYFGSTFNIFNQLPYFEMTLLGLYILAFIIEISLFVKRKDEIEIVEEEQSEQEYDNVNDPDSDIVSALSNSVEYGNKPDKVVNEVLREGNNEEYLAEDDQVFIEIAQTSLDNASVTDEELDTSDFIYGAAPSDDDFVMPVDSDNDSPYVVRSDESADMYITKADSAYDEEEEEKEASDFTIDRIDKLILEISEDEFN